MKFDITPNEYMRSGHVACPGCGAPLAMRYALKGLGPKTVIVLPACCWSIIDGPFPYSSVKVPLIHVAFETAASTASGVKAGLEMTGRGDINVLAWAGDGGTFDIGLQSLSGAAERNDDIVYTCYDNEAYMNTGIQRSSATPWGTWTTTTPVEHPKDQPKKKIVEILAAHRIPYAATGSVAYPDDLVRKFEKARRIKGTRFIHVLSPCPPGWKCAPEQAIKISRLAVHSRVFPIYEVENGTEFTLNIEPQGVPVKDYLRLQGRFSHLGDKEVEQIQRNVDFEWELLMSRVEWSKRVNSRPRTRS